MAAERSVDAILEGLYAQVERLWGEEEAESQRPALRQTAEEIMAMAACELPPDVEPRFF